MTYLVVHTGSRNLGKQVAQIYQKLAVKCQSGWAELMEGQNCMIAAYEGQKCIISLSMRDGVLICISKGHVEWNCSAPHRAGVSSQTFKNISLKDYANSMLGIYTECVNEERMNPR